MSAYWIVVGAWAVTSWGWRGLWIIAATVLVLETASAVISMDSARAAGAWTRGFLMEEDTDG
ncbi:hypothetical protein [Rhodobacter sp. NSM]|uniref:hypothetical protein n=1 Tax=Rhodobacter sp. NSM TaxID=3457501 RepID=UPI003FD6835C